MAEFARIMEQLQRGIGGAHAKAEDALRMASEGRTEYALVRQELDRQKRDIQNTADALSRIQAGNSRGAGGPFQPMGDWIVYLESIPGRRIPYDALVTIPINDGISSMQQQTWSVSQDGPFCAVARVIAFESALAVSRVDPTTAAQATFNGRSFGRFRPPHSAWDLQDAGTPFNAVSPLAFPGSGAPVFASPSNHSSFRSMEFDGFVNFLNQGSAFSRSNNLVPTTWWTSQINAAFQLGAIDFFERGETMQWQVTPSHVNNPAAGNASAYGAGGFYPQLASQYDVHEGIVDPQLAGVTTDPITRLANGFVLIGFHGFRIIQGPGPIRLT